MALSEQEEFEMLSLERERAMQSKPSASQADVRKAEPAPPAEPSLLDKVKGRLRTATALTPPAVVSRGIEAAGSLMDKAAYGAGEVVTDQAAKVLPPEAAAGVGFAANVGTQAIPTLLGGEAAKVASPAFRAGAEKLMHSALKPPLEALRDGSAVRAISTMLEQGINVSGGGVAKLRGMIDALNEQITKAIANSPATLHKGKVASELTSTVKRFERQVNPNNDVKAIEAAWEEFVNHPLLTGEQIPVKLAQEMKQGTYRILRDKYGQLGSASEEAQKTLARGLKEGIADAVPGVGEANAMESQLINALNLAERRQLLALNKNPAGLTLLAENPKAAAAFLADRSELFKSLVARMLNAGREQIPATAARAGMAGYEMATQNRQ